MTAYRWTMRTLWLSVILGVVSIAASCATTKYVSPPWPDAVSCEFGCES